MFDTKTTLSWRADLRHSPRKGAPHVQAQRGSVSSRDLQRWRGKDVRYTAGSTILHSKLDLKCTSDTQMTCLQANWCLLRHIKDALKDPGKHSVSGAGEITPCDYLRRIWAVPTCVPPTRPTTLRLARATLAFAIFSLSMVLRSPAQGFPNSGPFRVPALVLIKTGF